MRTGVPIACLLLSIGVAGAQLQSAAQLATNVAEKRAAGLESMKAYSWKSRTVFAKDGQAQSDRFALVRYDLDGSLQRTPIDTGADPKKKPRKPSKEQVRFAAALQELFSSYSLDSPDAIVDFINGATLTPGDPGILRARAFGVAQPGDQMTAWIDAGRQEIERVRVITRLGRDTVVMLTEYGNLDDGLQFVARRVARIPEKNVVFTVENFEFTRGP